MGQRLKILLIVLVLVWCVFSMGQSTSPDYDVLRQVLDGGGAMWLSTANYKLSSSLGQSISGVQVGATKTLYTGFWCPWVLEMTPVEWEEADYTRRPTDFGLRQNYPNPFNPATVIEYDLPKACEVKIEIYNVLGQRVRTLVHEMQEPAYKKIFWDGRDDGGNEISSGVYFYRLEAGTFVECRKMTLLK